jgi:hypothetical protein
MKKEATQKNAKEITQKNSDEKEAIPKNTKENQKTSNEKRGNPEKCKVSQPKDIRWKKRQPPKMQRGSFKRPQTKKEAIITKV